MTHTLRQAINHETDGPITSFVLITRAIKLAGAIGPQPDDLEAISNALYEELEERGWIDTDSLEENGS